MAKKKRKLFCEYGPVAYEISLFKEAVKKTIQDYLKGYKFAKEKSYDNLEYIWKGDAKILLRKLNGVDMQLEGLTVSDSKLGKGVGGRTLSNGKLNTLFSFTYRFRSRGKISSF